MHRTTIRTRSSSRPFHRLPLELLFHILELGSEGLHLPGVHSALAQRYGEDYFRRYFLRIASLISQDFRLPAQKLLWKFVILNTEERARRVLASPAFGKFVIQELQIVGEDACNCVRSKVRAQTASLALSVAKVTGTLELVDFTGVESLRTEVLFSKGLKNLKTLILKSVSLLDSPNLLSLGRLQIETLYVNEAMCITPPASIPVFGPALKQLSFRQQLAPSQTLVIEPLLTIGSQLRSLQLLHVDTYFVHLEFLFLTLTNLDHLDLTCSLFTFLYITRLLPSSLTSLRYSPKVGEDVDKALETITTFLDFPCAIGLKRLLLPSFVWTACADGEPAITAGGKTHKEIVKEWEERGLTVSLAPNCGRGQFR